MKYSQLSQAERWNVVSGPDGLNQSGWRGWRWLILHENDWLRSAIWWLLSDRGCSVYSQALNLVALYIRRGSFHIKFIQLNVQILNLWTKHVMFWTCQCGGFLSWLVVCTEMSPLSLTIEGDQRAEGVWHTIVDLPSPPLSCPPPPPLRDWPA